MAKRTDFYKELGERIAELRTKAKVSQTRMAEIIGIDRALISRFETQGEKLPAERIDEMLNILGYELNIVEKKKPLEKLSVKQRLQQYLKAAEDAVRELNEETKIEVPDFLRAPAASQTDQHERHQES